LFYVVCRSLVKCRIVLIHFLPKGQKLLLGQVLLSIEAAISLSDTPHSEGLLWLGDKLYAETST
jgi:hypothetical protein